jgi:accessory gene regulator protein AgrB
MGGAEYTEDFLCFHMNLFFIISFLLVKLLPQNLLIFFFLTRLGSIVGDLLVWYFTPFVKSMNIIVIWDFDILA